MGSGQTGYRKLHFKFESRIFENACRNFYNAHGRFPSFLTSRTTADFLFNLKFFDTIPIDPNPASKIEAINFVPDHLRDELFFPKRVHINVTDESEDISEKLSGNYWLKLDKGNSGHRLLKFPMPKNEFFKIINTYIERHQQRYGFEWGEWWYSLGNQNLFLERDLRLNFEYDYELKIFVRSGRAVASYLVSYVKREEYSHTFIRYFDREGNWLPGTVKNGLHGKPFEILDRELPSNYSRILHLAEVIGQKFDLIRIDFYMKRDFRPMLGELTLCHGNARFIFSDYLEEALVNRLFL